MDAMVADEIRKLREAIEWGIEEPLLNPRDQFALAVVASSGDAESAVMSLTSYAQWVYDVADALDAERRKRNAAEGR